MGFASKVRHSIDALTILQSKATKTASFASNGFDLRTLTGAFWDNSDVPWDELNIALNVTALDATTGDETYKFDVQVDDTADFSNSPVTVGSLTIGSTGYFVIVIDGKSLKELDLGANHLRLNVTLGGTTPSIEVESWIGPDAD